MPNFKKTTPDKGATLKFAYSFNIYFFLSNPHLSNILSEFGSFTKV